MSRSYKHTPITKDCDHKNFAKIHANRSYRRKLNSRVPDEDETLLRNKVYRKTYQQWQIHDSIWYQSYDRAVKQYEFYCTPNAYYRWWTSPELCEKYAKEFREEYPTLKSYITKSWKKVYLRK